jgi:quercetin dioxygenase-like cupin family protein
MSELHPVGDRVLFENDRVRVWEVTLHPGETQPLHRHEHPYLVVAVQSAMNVVETADGQRIDAPEPQGNVVFREPGTAHTLTNIGETRYVARLIELKRS